MATPIVADDTHLPRWAYRLLALLAGSIGLAASAITARFFVLGLERTEADSLARDVLILAGVLMIVVELAAFFIAALLPRRQLRALRWQLTLCALLLVGFEFATIAVTQMVLAKSADAVHDGISSRIVNLQATIAAQRSAAAALVATGSRSGQSVIASSRADGAQSLREAARIEGRIAALSAELARLQADQRPTLTTILGEPLTLVYNCARAGLITVMGLVMFAAAGALLRAGRAVSPVVRAAPAQIRTGYAHGIEAAPAGVPTALPSTAAARRWAAAAGLGGAAAIAAPAFAAVPPVVPMAAAAAAASTSMHPDASTSMQSAAAAPMADAVDAPVKKARRAAAPRAGSVRDTGVGEDDGARFLRVKEGIEAGRIKPSLRAIYAAEGASQEVSRRYLAALERAGVIERQGRGYKLA